MSHAATLAGSMVPNPSYLRHEPPEAQEVRAAPIHAAAVRALLEGAEPPIHARRYEPGDVHARDAAKGSVACHAAGERPKGPPQIQCVHDLLELAFGIT